MKIEARFALRTALAVLALTGSVFAQSAASAATNTALSAASRLAGDWRSSALLQIAGSGVVAGASDLGAASTSQPLGRMVLLLKSSSSQQQALAQKLIDLQTPTSSSFHQWLTPAAYAAAYGNSPADVAALVAWLQSEGFTVAALPAGRGWIEFSGSVAQVEQAFGVSVHSYSTASGTRLALRSSISIPAAFEPVVAGLASLDGSLSTAALTTPRTVATSTAKLAALTTSSSAEALSPKLAASLLHMDQLQLSGVTGAGQTIAIASRSNISADSVAAFRTSFGLKASPVQIQLNGSDPGFAEDQQFATLAAEWAGATATGASILVVPAATTAATDGVDLALAAIIDGALANTVTVGYSSCEAGLSRAHSAFYAALYQQAAAEGLSVIAATGDSGAAACAVAGSSLPVSSGYAVNALASTPWNTAVGLASFKSTTATAEAANLTALQPASQSDPAYASGGGASLLYSAPSWQTAASNSATASTATTSTSLTAQAATSTTILSAAAQAQVEAAGQSTTARMAPDVVLPTAADASLNPGLAFCATDVSGSCTLERAGGSAASSAMFAGVSALLAQKYGAQGNLASGLHKLATVGGVYNDVSAGSSSLTCAAGSTGCSTTGQIGYTAESGYDLATGLGSVNVQALVSSWPQVTAMLGTGTANLVWSTASGTVNRADANTLVVTLTPTNPSTTTPTGTVNFYDITSATPSVSNQVGYSTLQPGTGYAATATLSLAANALTAGTRLFEAVYSGDTNFTTSDTTTTGSLKLYVLVATTTTWNTAQTQTLASTASLALSATTASGDATVTSAPTGTVTFTDSTKGTLGTAALNSTSAGVAAYTVNSGTLAAGAHTINAAYAGDGTTYEASSTTSTGFMSVNVTAADMVQWTTQSQTIDSANTINLVAKVTSNSSAVTSTPTGTITFYDGTLGANINATAVALSGGTATYTVPASYFTAGTHAIQANYSGSTIYDAGDTSTTGNISLAVLAPSTTTWTTATQTIASTGSLVLTAKVASGSTTTTSTPVGTVTFYDVTTGGTLTAVGLTSANNGTATYTLTAGALAVGTHVLQATYSNSSVYSTSSTSTTGNITITVVAGTTTTFTTSTQTISTATALTLTATIASASSSNTATPTGTVTFTDSSTGTTLGTATLSGGTASYTLAAGTLANGTHAITASYGGSASFGASTTTTNVTITVLSATNTLWTTASSSIAYTTAIGMGVSVTTTDSTQTSTPTGTVTYYDVTSGGSTQLGTGSVVGGTSVLTMAAGSLTIGSHTLQAVYGGSTTFATSSTATSGNIALDVQALSTTTWTTTTQSIASTAALTLSATVATATSSYTTTPTGTVTFTDVTTGTTLGTGTLSNGTATFALAAGTLSAGAHVLLASYGGSTTYGTSTTYSTGNITVTEQGASTTTWTTASQNLSSATALTLTVNVASSTSALTTAPTGTVTFYDVTTSTTLGTGTLASGVATLTVAAGTLTSGAHVLQATYGGNTTYTTSSTSTSGNITATVLVASTTTWTTATQSIASTSGISLVVTVASGSTSVTTTPTGTVTFTDTTTGATLGTATLASGTATLALVAGALINGTHVLTATYGGNTTFATSTTTTSITVSVLAPSVTTWTTLSQKINRDTSLSLSVTVASGSTTVTSTPTGTVTFYDETTSKTLGSATLSGGVATLKLAAGALASGSAHTIIATYNGSTIYASSSSGEITITVSSLIGTTVLLTANRTTIPPGGAVTLTATVIPDEQSTSQAYPTGSVEFLNGTTLLGSCSLVELGVSDQSYCSITLASGSVGLPAGTDSITALYLGDTYYATGISDALTLTVQDFTITAASTNPPEYLTIIKGGSGADSFVITALGGFTGTVNIVCTASTADYLTCAPSAQQITPTATITVAVQTYTSNTKTAMKDQPLPFWSRAAGGTVLALLGFFMLPSGRKVRRLLEKYTGRAAHRTLLLLLLLVGLAGAGLGCTNSTTAVSAGTPLGVTTLKLTASSYVDNVTVSRTAYFAINVVSK